MIHRVTCPQCGALCQYDDKSVWEGNREQEEFFCPECHYVLGTAFTDLIPIVELIKKGERSKMDYARE